VVFVNVKDPASIPPGAWTQTIQNSNYVAMFYDDVNTMVFRTDMQEVPLLRVLIIFHEFRHIMQAQNPLPKVPNYQQIREVDAYDYEFALLDKLSLPHWNEAVSTERARLRPSIRNNIGFKTNLDDPNAEKVFGKFPSTVSRYNAATIIMLRSAFAEIDSQFSPPLAIQRKIMLLKGMH